MKLRAFELRLADVVQLEGIATSYNFATVKNFDPQGPTITFFRPYVVTSDFSYTGGVMCYTGVEEFNIQPRPGELFEVIERKELK